MIVVLEELTDTQGLIVLVNAVIVGAVLVLGGAMLTGGSLSVESPAKRQVVGEAILSFFVGKGRAMAHGPRADRIMRSVVPLLATLFLFIFVCNLIAIFPMAPVNRPPTSHFSVTLGLALFAVGGTLVTSAAVKGGLATAKHLVWPNPLQWVSEVTDVLSLSLRLFGNIAGEFMTVVLVLAVVPWGIPLILHALGLIPTFVQALVFTLLTASFLADSVHETPKKARRPRSHRAVRPVAADTTEGGGT